jgi:sigma-B regulation protein RsbU (phosphoserine phosphatase)
MADVSGKGVAAALYMALSWSLFRTYAGDFPTHPEMTLTSVNQRLVEDTSINQYVSVFYGILDPKSGRFNYSNGGHCLPILINYLDGKIIRPLGDSGKSLGIYEQETWMQKTLEIQPGEALVIHTGGIAEARNRQQESYQQQGLIASIQEHPGLPAVDLVEALYTDLKDFMGDTPQEDDLALAVLAREDAEVS